MGQQQLLLLVLSTVIVGLATVAGIQAFDEGQSQAANDALTQRAVSVASDIQAQAKKPAQLGGIDPTSDGNTTIANAIGIEKPDSVDASGAGQNANCKITRSNSATQVKCQSDNTETNVTAEVSTSDGSGDISTSFSTGTI